MMRKLPFIFLLLIALYAHAQDSVSTGSKSKPVFRRDLYIEDLSDMINVSPFLSKSYTGFTLSGGRDIQYTPNEGVTLGIKLQHKWLGLAIAYSPRKLQDKDIGQSDFINIVLNSYGRSIGFDAYFLTYKGYLIENIKDLENLPPGPEEKKNPNRFRYDLQTLNTGFNAYYIFNGKKLSYRSTFLQNEWQKKSAGSFVITASFNYYQIAGDSTILPVKYDPKADEQGRLKNGDFYSFALMPGYTHTFVLRHHFFLTLSPFGGIMYQLQDYTTENNLHVERVSVIPRFMGRAGIGYNSKRFYAGFSSINDVYNLQLAKGTRINNQISSVVFYAGIRLSVPKSMKKYSDLLGKMDPMHMLQLRKN